MENDGDHVFRSHHYRHGDPLAEDGGWPGWVEPPYPPVDLGPCQICGHPTRRYCTWRNRDEAATGYACVWCRAVTDVFHTGAPGHVPVPSRPLYAAPDGRWDEASGGSPRRRHASGHWGLTLCGLTALDFTEDGPLWRPEHTDACPACRAAAAEIDARWPTDRRDDGDFLVACPCPACWTPTSAE